MNDSTLSRRSLHIWRRMTSMALYLVFLAALILTACTSLPAGSFESTNNEDLDDVAYVWTREGGIVGFCDRVTVFTTGLVEVDDCAHEETATTDTVELTSKQQDAIEAWVSEIEAFNYKDSDPAVADALTIRIDFRGQGIRAAGDEEIAAMNTLALEVLRRVNE